MSTAENLEKEKRRRRRKRREKRWKKEKKDHEKILEEIIVENFPKMGKEIITQV